MNNYKKVIKSQDLRFALLNFMKFVPDSWMLKWQYRIKLNKKLNLNAPRTYTEKLQWYKLYYHDSLMTICADKYRVREFVTQKGLENTLIQLYGVYDCVEEINFDNLPDKFVIKTTNGSGTVLLCQNKSELNIENTKKTLKSWLSRPMASLGREWAYKDIHSKIVIEELLSDSSNTFSGINDYKILCFNGKPELIAFYCDRAIETKRAFYTPDWRYLDVTTSNFNQLSDVVEKPKCLNQILDIASKLSGDFPHVRVDLYICDDKVYFGELTFYYASGYISFEPKSFDLWLGDKFVLPPKKIERLK